MAATEGVRKNHETKAILGFSLFPKRLRYSGGMANAAETRRDQERAGLCADCVHARNVESSRGSIFLLCDLSRSDPRFVKYPRLPILLCPGYEKNPEQADRS
jgi:hypothetical protein